MNDVRRMIYGTITLFFVVLAFWLGLIYVSSCGLTLSCKQAAPKVDRTPIPTLIPAKHSDAQPVMSQVMDFTKCQVLATDLIGAWLTAGAPADGTFAFSDANGGACEGTYMADIEPLLRENGVWYKNSIGCVSCHNGDLTGRSGGLDLTSYDAILRGAGRADANAKGKDVLGGGSLNDSTLYQVLVTQGLTAKGHAADASVVSVAVYAGTAVPEAEATATP
jgi:hypothetical protein